MQRLIVERSKPVSDAHLPRISRILDKLSEVRKRQLSCFGSDSHRFHLNPPVSLEELRRFETTHGIELPGCYRAFLLNAGDGGAGPYYGLYPLDKWDDFADWVLDDRPADFLARPCPLKPGSNPGPKEWIDAEILPFCQGTLSIGSQGCSYVTQLIITGPHRGRVAYMDADGRRPSYVVRDHDFLSWYERWLDELLNGYETSWFGFGPGGGEAEFFAILSDPEADDEIKGEAAYAFRRLPQLTEAAAARIPELLEHALDGVRAGVCGVIRKFAIQTAAGRVAGLLDDPSPQIRQEAVWTLMHLAPDRWADAVLQAMRRETNSGVASSAFFSLRKAEKLTKADLLQIIQTSRLKGLRGLALYALEWSADDWEMAVGLLDDPEPDVRRYAILGLRQLKNPASVSALVDCLVKEQDVHNVSHLLRALGEFADPSASGELLKRAVSGDDFQRLDAVEALIRIGDQRAAPVIWTMLWEDRSARRQDPNGFTSMTSVFTIQKQVCRMLTGSHGRRFLRKFLAGQPGRLRDFFNKDAK